MIRLSKTQQETIERHGAETFPYECCGVLLGDVEGETRIVREVRPLPNVFEPSLEFEQSVEGVTETALQGQERRFMVSPDMMFALMREERKTKRQVLGFYHSHPNHPAKPSAYDKEWASPWYSYLIVSIMQGVPAEMTAWILDDDRALFQAIPIEMDTESV